MTHFKRLLFLKRAKRRIARRADDPAEVFKNFVQVLTRMQARGAAATFAEKA
jgi:hypothetical protein